MRKPVRCIDWSQVIFDLERTGMSLGEIAAGCGYRPATRAQPDDGGKAWAFRLKNIPDTQPDFHSGALLIGLWADKMGRPIDDIPRAEFRFVRNALGRIQALPLVDVPAHRRQAANQPEGPDPQSGRIRPDE